MHITCIINIHNAFKLRYFRAKKESINYTIIILNLTKYFNFIIITFRGFYIHIIYAANHVWLPSRIELSVVIAKVTQNLLD